MADAQECARVLLETIPGLMRGLVGAVRQQRVGEDEPLTMGQFRLMQMLAHCPRTLGELASSHQVAPSTMSRSVDVLVRRAWVTRQHAANDRRQVILKLTDDGMAATEAMARQARDEVTRLIERLDDDERARLYDGLRVLRSLVAQMNEAKACEA